MNQLDLKVTRCPQRFIQQDRLRLSLELNKCKRELSLALQAKKRVQLTYRSIVIALIVLNFITYGALLYVKYNPAPCL
ncbi:hypothetical protein [Acinetobacter sp. CFCC 10889]|uniref:hypothetical protein n=1 Tax=Acinetobacter sp. CFCC 10889 TaxID=1775557 RepID=UPI000DD0C78C|nr:hypothetical protein [Acinetobacter sp. CFCC 10889]